MVEIVEDTELTAFGGRGATLEVTAGGKIQSYSVAHVPGDPEQPLTRSELIEKFNAGAVPAIGTRRVEEIVRRILDGPLDAPLTFPE